MPVQTFLGDCLEIMPTLADESVDTIITSPPYNIGKDYECYVDNRNDYLQMLRQFFYEAKRITRDSLWVNLGYQKLPQGNIPIAFMIWEAVNMFLVQQITWEYGSGMTYKSRFNHRSETWLWYVKDPTSYTFNADAVRDPALSQYPNDKRNNPIGKLPSDVWYFPTVSGTFKERCKHPAQYPIAMIERIIKASTNPGDTVLDPFMGSGSTGVACMRTGRNFKGIEINPVYVTQAQRRIAEAQQQMQLGITEE